MQRDLPIFTYLFNLKAKNNFMTNTSPFYKNKEVKMTSLASY